MPVNRLARARSLNRNRAASAIRGSKSFRRLLRGMPDAVRAEMADVLTKAGPSAAALIERRIDATTRRRTGSLRAAVKWKVFPRTLRLQAGFLGNKSTRTRVFYARILDLGRRAQTVVVTRRQKVLRALGNNRNGNNRRFIRAGQPYKLRVRAIAAKRFVTAGAGGLRQVVGVQLKGIWERALRRIAAGDE